MGQSMEGVGAVLGKGVQAVLPRGSAQQPRPQVVGLHGECQVVHITLGQHRVRGQRSVRGQGTVQSQGSIRDHHAVRSQCGVRSQQGHKGQRGVRGQCGWCRGVRAGTAVLPDGRGGRRWAEWVLRDGDDLQRMGWESFYMWGGCCSMCGVRVPLHHG
uniref:Uncharacterized protein n=1 Tax=Gallus gallus TaxID=9031 RepID=A0A8V0ZL90_CHICK